MAAVAEEVDDRPGGVRASDGDAADFLDHVPNLESALVAPPKHAMRSFALLGSMRPGGEREPDRGGQRALPGPEMGSGPQAHDGLGHPGGGRGQTDHRQVRDRLGQIVRTHGCPGDHPQGKSVGDRLRMDVRPCSSDARRTEPSTRRS